VYDVVADALGGLLGALACVAIVSRKRRARGSTARGRDG
jgi:hypothetical protein